MLDYPIGWCFRVILIVCNMIKLDKLVNLYVW